MGGGSLGNLIIRRRFDRVNQVRELDSILYEEDRNVVSNNVKVSLISVATMVSAVFAVPGEMTYNRVAKPWTSRAVSALPLDPATVEKRTNVGVVFPLELRNEAAVTLL